LYAVLIFVRVLNFYKGYAIDRQLEIQNSEKTNPTYIYDSV